MANNTIAYPLVDQVRSIQPDNIKLPILRELVRDIQAKSPEDMRRDCRYWTDSNWRQWRQHSSHNPW